MKKTKRVEGFLWKKRKRGGAQGKIALLPPPSAGNRGGEGLAVAAPCAGEPGHGGGHEEGEKRGGGAGNRFPHSPEAGAVRGGLAMRAGGGGQRHAWRRRWRAGEGAGGGGGGRRGGGPRGGALL